MYRMQYNAMRTVGLERKRRKSGKVMRRTGFYVVAVASLDDGRGAVGEDFLTSKK